MRDNHKPKAFFDERIEAEEKSVLSRDYIMLYNTRFLPDKDGIRKLTPLQGGYTERLLGLLPKRYCRGDDLSGIKTSIIDVIQDRYIYLCEEMEKNSQKYIYRFREDGPHGYHSVYTWLCWFLCLGGSPEKISKISPYLCEAGKDRLLDLVCSRFEPTRKIAPDCANPNTFGLLEQVINASSAERIKLLEEYLQNWPKFMGSMAGITSLGIYVVKEDVETREELISDLNGHYKGFWAWEVALVVKFFNVDDSTLKDNEFYPYDMVHFLD